MHPRGFHYLIFIVMVKRILLLALVSSRTAAVGIRFGSYVVGRSAEKGPPRGCGAVPLSLSPPVDPSVWVTGGESVTLDRRVGTGNTYFSGVNSPVLGDHLTSWDRKPEGPNR